MRQFNHRLVANIQALIPDTEYIQSDSDNTTATLRLTYRGTQTWYKIEQEQSSSTLLSGFALLGGAWTFINGLFATVFGCTLLLVLFGNGSFRHVFTVADLFLFSISMQVSNRCRFMA